MGSADEYGHRCRSCRYQRGLPGLCGPVPCPSVLPCNAVRAGRWRRAPAGAASVTNCRVSDEVPPRIDAGRRASRRCRDEHRNVPTRLPVHPGNRVSSRQVYRLLRENNPLSRRAWHRRGKCLLSLRSFSGPPTPCGASAAFGSSLRTAAETGGALRSGIETPGMSASMRAGEVASLHLAADIRGSIRASMPLPVPVRASTRELRMEPGSRLPTNAYTNRTVFPFSEPPCAFIAQSRAIGIGTTVNRVPCKGNIHCCRMRPPCV